MAYFGGIFFANMGGGGGQKYFHFRGPKFHEAMDYCYSLGLTQTCSALQLQHQVPRERKNPVSTN